MASVKDIIVKPINATMANNFVKAHHYSGKVVPCLFIDGPNCITPPNTPFRKHPKCSWLLGTINLVKGTTWNGFIELNRMAFSELLPKNAESRCISVAIRLIKKFYPNIKWIISFADGCQCGDGTIYRASGFKLVGVTENTAIRINPKTHELVHVIQAHHLKIPSKEFNKWEPLKGNMLKYIYFIDKSYEKFLTVPVLSFNMIDKMNARMYKGKAYKKDNACLVQEKNACVPVRDGGAIPTNTHQVPQTNNNNTIQI